MASGSQVPLLRRNSQYSLSSLIRARGQKVFGEADRIILDLVVITIECLGEDYLGMADGCEL
jgi:hypothetical protein